MSVSLSSTYLNLTRIEQEEALKEILLRNKAVQTLLHTPIFPGGESWYLGAGAITCTIWNYLTYREITYGIADYDIIYFDEDVSYEAEDKHITRIQELFKGTDIDVDIKNEARVHLWSERRFGIKIDPYLSCEDALESWSSCTGIGVTVQNGILSVYAPFGFDDLFNMILRPNKNHQAHAPRDIYEAKADKWSKMWPEMTVIGWDEE